MIVLLVMVKVVILADCPGTQEAHFYTGSRPDSRVPEYPLRTLISCKSVAAVVSSKASRGWKNVVPHPMRQKATVDLPAHFLPATTAASLTSSNASHSISSQSSIFTIFVLADRFQKQLQYSRRAITVHSKNRVKTDIQGWIIKSWTERFLGRIRTAHIYNKIVPSIIGGCKKN